MCASLSIGFPMFIVFGRRYTIIFGINVHVDENELHLVKHFMIQSSLYIIKASHLW